MTKVNTAFASVGAFAGALLLSFSAPAQNMLAGVNQVQGAVTPATGTAATDSLNASLPPLSVTCSVGNVVAIDRAVEAAGTPEQAARLFAKIVSPTLGQAIANAVQRILAQTDALTVNPANPTIQGWQELVLQKGLAVELNWPSPGLATAGNLPVTLVLATGPTTTGDRLAVTVDGTF
jgi:hypothetical protein